MRTLRWSMAAAIAVALVAHSGAAAITFTSETVDDSGSGAYSSLEVDSQGRVHISYQGDGLNYATKANGAWTLQSVFGPSGDYGWSTSLELDSHEEPQISFGSGDILSYVYKPGGAWTEVNLDPRFVWEPTSLVLDDADGPHIAYLGQPLSGEWEQVYARNVGSGWEFFVVTSDDPFNACTGASIAVDNDGTPHICCSKNPTGELLYYTRSGASWQCERLDGQRYGGLKSLVLDAAQNPHISCYDRDSKDVAYVRRSGGTWYVELVDGGGNDVGRHSSLQLDGFGNPHVAYYDQTAGDLRYTRKVNGAWETQIVDSSSNDVGRYCSLALDEFGNVHIGYWDETATAVKYAFGAQATGAASRFPSGPTLTVSPNPVPSGAVTVRYRVGAEEAVELIVYDVAGRRVRSLPGRAPESRLEWNGRDDNGRAVAAGTYFVRLVAGQQSATERVTLIR